MKKNIKNINKYSKVLVALFIVYIVVNNGVFAAITAENGEITTENPWGTIGTRIGTAIWSAITQATTNISLSLFSLLLSALAVVLFIGLQALFSTVFVITDDLVVIPFPDTIVFNKMPFFDANFINPIADNISPISQLKGIISNVYDSFVIIAIALFTAIAMIIGIKLALSSLAAEKAKYKQAIAGWVSGIIILLCLKWILAGMFKINELICAAAYKISSDDMPGFNVFSVSNIPTYGSTIAQLFSWFDRRAPEFATVHGYLGLTLKYIMQGIGGDMIGSLVAFVIMGQTISIVFVYIRRMVYCMLLGVVGPLVVAIDTINRSIGKGSQLLGKWFKQLGLTIFIQSFHATFMTVILYFLAKISSELESTPTMGVIVIMLTTALVKFEKVLKNVFGMGDSFMGDLKGGAAKALAGIKMGEHAIRSIGDNGKKLSAAKNKKASLTAEKAKIMQKMSASNLNINGGSADISTGDSNAGDDFGGNAASNTNTNTQSNSGSSMGDNHEIIGILKNISNQLAQNNGGSNADRLQQINRELAQAESEMSSARLASFMAPVSVAAGAAFGLGMDDMASGALMTTALDNAAEKIGARGADYKRSRMYDESKEQGVDDPEILRKKSGVRQAISSKLTMQDLRDVSSIMSGKYDSDKNNKLAGIKGFKYVAEKIDRGHDKLASSVDNIN